MKLRTLDSSTNLRTLFFTFAIAASAVASSRAQSAGDVKRTWDFESEPPGRIARGMIGPVGRWVVVEEGSNHVLAQQGKSEDAAFNIALAEATRYRDVDLRVHMEPKGGDVDRGGGLVWRARDANNYYLARYNPLEDNFRLYKVVAGTRTQIQSVKTPPSGRMQALRVVMVGDSVACFLDGVRYLEARDSTFPEAGMIGLWTKADARSEFDDLQAAVATRATLDAPALAASEEPPMPTREFEIRHDRPYLGGQPIDLWGLRCGNALYSEVVTERHIRNFDNMVEHGINCIGVYIQGTNAGYPDPDAGLDGFRRDGRLKPEVARRLEWLIREADKRGMVVMVGILGPRKDQDLYDDAAIQRAIEEAGRFLTRRRLRNVFVDIMHEFDQPERIDHALLREPDGAAKKARLTKWFKEAAPGIEAGVCPDVNSDTADSYPGMDVRIIQKQAAIPSEGFVVNVETLRQDFFEQDGIFSKSGIDYITKDCERYLEAPHAVMLFHAAFIQGLTNGSKTAPHPEMGGYGTGPQDRGVRFYYDWVRKNVGRYEYPRHIKAAVGSQS